MSSPDRNGQAAVLLAMLAVFGLIAFAAVRWLLA